MNVKLCTLAGSSSLLMLITVCEFILLLAGGRQPVHQLRFACGGPDYFTDCHLDQQGCTGHLFQPGHLRMSQSRNLPGPNAIPGLCQNMPGQAADFCDGLME